MNRSYDNEVTIQSDMELYCTKEFIIVPRASHLFEEKGALEKGGEMARDWFMKYFLPQA